MLEIFNNLYKFYDEKINEHKLNINQDDTPTDFVAAFLAEKSRRDKIGEVHNYS